MIEKIIDLNDYFYNKAEIDQKVREIDTDISTLDNDISLVYKNINDALDDLKIELLPTDNEEEENGN